VSAITATTPKTRELSPELAAFPLDSPVSDIPFRSVFYPMSDTVVVPTRERLMSVISLGVKKGDFTTAEMNAVQDLDGDVLASIKHSRKPEWIDVRHFASAYIWGGEEFLHYARMGNVLVMDGMRNGRLVYLLESDWRMDEPLGIDELVFILKTTTNFFRWEDVSLAEALYVINRDRAGMTRWVRDGNIFGYWGKHRHEINERLHDILEDDSALAWSIAIQHWGSSNEAKMNSGVIDDILEIAEKVSFDEADPYIRAGIHSLPAVIAGINGIGTDAELIRSLMEGAA